MRRNPLSWLSEALLTVTAIPVLAMMLHVTLDVVLKYTLRVPIQGTLEITAFYYMVAIVLLPMAFIELTRQSIAVDLFYQMMPPGLQVAVTAIVLLVSALGYGGLAWISLPSAISSYEKGEIVMGTARLIIWPSRFLLPAALAIAALVCLVHLVRLIVSPAAREALTAIDAPDPDVEVN